MPHTKLPAFQFYTGDWLKDPKLSMCQPATRGIWMDAIAAMHENSRSGTLAGTADQLARVTRCTESAFMDALHDLQATGAADITERNGIITLVNRRMNREAKERELNRIRQKRFKNNAEDNGLVTENSRPLSSSSSSKDTSSKHNPPYIPPKGEKKSKPKTACPEDFVITDDMREWHKLHAPSVNIDTATENFIDRNKAKGTVYRDWQAAWRTWMRNAVEWQRPSWGSGVKPLSYADKIIAEAEEEERRKSNG